MPELFAIAVGLVLLYLVSKEAPPKLLEAADWLLISGGFVVGACSTFYWSKYQSRGELDTVHVGYPEMLHAPGTGMGAGTMGPGMGGGGMGSMPYQVAPSLAPADGTR
jgi:hypothetical protein